MDHHRLTHRHLLFLLCLVLPVTAAGTVVAPVSDALYEGVFVDQLTWRSNADGTLAPNLPDVLPWAETGRPALGVRDLRLLVPLDASVGDVEIVPLATHRVRVPGRLATGGTVLSSEGRAISSARLPQAGAVFPAVWGEFAGVQVWRGFRFVGVRVYPLRAMRDATGEWNEIELLDRFAVRLVPGAGSAPDAADVAQRERWLPGERSRVEAVLTRLVNNPEVLRGYARADGQLLREPAGDFAPSQTPDLSGSSVRFVIITRPALVSQFQRLADHRTALGLPTVVKTVEWIEENYKHGADVQETIRLFIREAYQRWGVDYVLLGGDTDLIPPRYARSDFYPSMEEPTDIPADLYFGCLDGNWNADGDALYAECYVSAGDPGDNADLADEVRVGRAPVSSASAAGAFVDKILAYEQQPAGAGWTNRMAFAAEVLWPSDYTPGAPISTDGATFAETIINDSLTPCTGMSAARMYEAAPLWPGAVPLTRGALIDTLNSGHYGIVNQIGHGFFFNMSVGDANFMVGDADALTNTGRPFILYALNCASAAFDYACLMERFVQNPNGGSLASIGAARAAFPFTSGFYQGEFFRLLFCADTNRLGDLMSQSRLPRVPETYANSTDRWTFLNYTLLGDPTVPAWAGSPQAPNVAAPAALTTGAQNVTVTVTVLGVPVPGALVCLSAAGDDYAAGETDAVGEVTLSFTPVHAGTAVLSVSGAGLAITASDIPVTTAGAYIALSGVTLADDGTAGSSGNGDGRLDAGETVAVWAQYHDTGTGGAVNCAGVLSGGVTGLTIIDGTAAIGDVPSGGVKAATEPFLVRADAPLPDGFHVGFTVTVTAPVGGPYDSEWNPVVLAPETSPIALAWSDATYGNNDKVQQNGERITLAVTLKNYGAGLSGPITARLRTASSGVTLYDTLTTYPSLALMQESANATPLSLAEANVAVDHPCWILFADQFGRTLRHDFRLSAPGTPTDLIADSALGPDVIALTWPPVTTAGVRGYHVYRSTSSTGPFARVDKDLIERTSYFRDEGLTLLTRYYYKVSAVDSSLYEGPVSAVISLSTAPPEQAGFPLPMAKETSGHAAVGDVDGDGSLEVVLGADKLYVWTATGGEIRDGDHNAQTHGPFSDVSGNFGPAGVTLANLDSVPGMEIIAHERTANKVHIFCRDGTELPGWPRALQGTSWAWTTPAVGDVDGDGQPEIVLNDIAGRTLAWHADGTELRDGDSNPATDGVFVVRSGATWEYSFSSPALYDLDGDGGDEIIFGSKLSGTPNYLFAYRADGSQAPGFPWATGNAGSIACSPSIGDLNNDGVAEIVFVSESDSLYVVQQNGTRYPGFPIGFVSNALGGGISCPSPALGDFDNDGQLEIAAVATYTSANAQLRLIDTNIAGGTSGQLMAGWPRAVPGNSESSPVVGDINGDGTVDIVYGIGGGDESTPNNLYAYNANGTLIPGFPITLGGPIRPAPILCDLNGDGNVNIVYGGWDMKIHVWDMPFAYHENLMPWPTFRGNHWRNGVHGRRSETGVPGEAPPAPLAVAPNYPNPFNPSTTVRLYVPGPLGGAVALRLRVYDVRGRLVRTLHDGQTPTGWQTWLWDGRDGSGKFQASGVYLLRAQAGDQVRQQKMALIK